MAINNRNKELKEQKQLASLEASRLSNISKRVDIKNKVVTGKTKLATAERKEITNERQDISYERKEDKYQKKINELAIKKDKAFVEKGAQRLQAIGTMFKDDKAISARRRNQLASLKAQKEQFQRVAKAADVQGQYPNKFERILQARKMALDSMEASRQFHSPRKDFNKRMNELHQQDRDRERINAAECNLLRAHEQMCNVDIDFTDTKTPHLNILMTPNLFSSDNPNRRNIMKTGRPNILSPQEEDKKNKEKAKLKFF